MPTTMLITAFVIFGACIIGVLIGWVVMSILRKPFEKEMEEEAFLRRVHNRTGFVEEDSTSESFFSKTGRLVEKILPTSRARMMEYQVQLDSAGMKITAGVWHGIVIFAIVAGAVLGFIISFIPAKGLDLIIAGISVAIGGFLGWLLVTLYLRSKTKSRRAEIEKKLPDALERLSNITLSGLTIDEAFQELSRADDLGAVGEEFARVSREINFVNIPRDEALQAMAQRCQCVDVTFFTSSIIQAMKDGTPVASALQQQAVNARAAWFDRLKAEINKLDTKITLPLGLCYMPATMVLVVAPVFYQAASSFITLF